MSASYKTSRLTLRDLGPQDGASVLALLSDMTVVRYTLFPLFTREKAEEFVTSCQNMQTVQPITNFTLGIVLSADNSFIGLGGLVVNPWHQTAEVWYLLAASYWGQGLMSEAARELIRIGFQELRLHRIWATCLPENPASSRVLEKLGFRREGHQRENLPIHGSWRDSYLYALLDREWVSSAEDRS